LERWQIEIAVVALPKLTADGAVEAFDPAVEFGTAWRQDVEGNVLLTTGEFEFRHEFGAAIDLDGLNGNGHAGAELVEEGGSGRSGGGTADPDDRAPRNHVDGRELPPFPTREGTQVHGVKLNQGTGHGGCALVLRHTDGIGTEGTSLPNPDAMRFDQQSACAQRRQDATDTGFREDETLPREQDTEFGFAGPGRCIPQAKDGRFLLGAPLATAGALRTTGAGLETPQIGGIVAGAPAVDGGATAAKDDDGIGDAGSPGMFDAAQPKLHLWGQRRSCRKGTGTPWQAMDDVEGVSHPAASDTRKDGLAMLHDEGISWVISVGQRRQDTKADPLISSPSPSHMFLNFYRFELLGQGYRI